MNSETTYKLTPIKLTHILLSKCTLHNFFPATKDAKSNYAYQRLLDHKDPRTQWRPVTDPQNAFLPLQPATNHNYSNLAEDIRKELIEYIMTSSGEIPWQYERIAGNSG